MDKHCIPKVVYEDLLESGLTPEQIEPLTAKRLFEKYLEWNGIIGYGYLFDIVVDLVKAENRE